MDVDGHGAGGRSAADSPLHRLAVRLEHNAALDAPAALLQRVGDEVLADERLHAAMRGQWLGHALHPALTDLPLGFWTSATVLDLVGGPTAEVAARRLVALGLAAAVPTVLAGLSDWLSATREERRVGTVHAAANEVAVLFYALSLVDRYRGRHRRAVVFGVAGSLAAAAGGYLGGHLSHARGTDIRAAFAAPAPLVDGAVPRPAQRPT